MLPAELAHGILRVADAPMPRHQSNDRQHILTDRVRGAPDLVIEILSPKPRVGRLREHLEWFAGYDVRECWLYHQFERRREVLTFGNGDVTSRESFDDRTAIRSTVLPTFERTLASIIRRDH